MARYFAELKREDDVRDAVQFAKPATCPYLSSAEEATSSSPIPIGPDWC